MGRKRLNKNVLIALGLFSFALMIVLSVLMLLQLRRRDPHYFVELARQHEREEQWKSAALFYLKAWERSLDPIHLISHADMLLNEGDVRLALAGLNAALVARPDFTAAHVRRLELLLELARLYGNPRDWKSVQEGAEAFLAAETDATTAHAAMAHNANGLALAALSPHDETIAARSEAELRRACELVPDNESFALDLAWYLHGRRRFEEAEAFFQTLLSAYDGPGPDAAAVRLAYGQFLDARNRTEEAETQFQQCIALAAGDPTALQEARVGYGAFLFRRWGHSLPAPRATWQEGRSTPQADRKGDTELFERAEALFQQCIEARPADFAPYSHLAALYAAAARHAEAVDVCDKRLALGFSRRGVKGQRNRLDFFSLLIQASTASVAEAVAAQERDEQSERERWLEHAERYLADARAEIPSHPHVAHQSGRIKIARGLEREALDDLRAAEEAYRTHQAVNWDNKFMLARLHLKLQEPGAARTLLEDAMEPLRRQRPADPIFWTLYAQVLLGCDEPDRAMAVCEQVLESAPDYPDALRVKAAIYERKGRHEEAARILEALTGDRALSAILVAQQHVLDDEVERGLAVLRQALADDPGDVRIVGAAVRALLRAQQPDEARRVVEAALQIHPGDLQLQRLSLLVRADLTPEQQDAAMLEIIQAGPDAYQRALDLVGFYGRKGQIKEAFQAVDEALRHLAARDTPVAQNVPRSQHRTLLATKMRVAAMLDDADAMGQARDAAARFNVDGAGGRSILGLYHLLRNEYDAAAKALREAADTQPTDSRTLTRLGQCLHLLNRRDEAEAAYDRAVRVNPNEGEAHKGLALLAKQRGDTKVYEAALSACARLIPYDHWVQSEVTARVEEADPHSAIARREKDLAENPQDFEGLSRLAALYEKTGDQPKADACFARMLELRPDDKDVVSAAGRYFRRTGRPERSLEVATRFADSRATAEAKANARILLASHYLATQELDQVEETLLSAERFAETFEVAHSAAEFYLHRLGRADQALPWYDKALERARASNPDQIPRMMAARITCRIHRQVNDTAGARNGIQELRSQFPEYAEVLLLQSELYERTGQIEGAIGALTEYLARRPNDPSALYQRALFHQARGRIAAAMADLLTLKHTSPLALDLKPRFLLTQLYQQTGEEKERIGELESMARDAPDAPAVLEALARAYVDAKRPADAERIITAQINRSAGQPDARWLFLRGRVSAQLGDTAEALADFRRGAENAGYTADAVAEVLDWCLQLNRPAEGIEFYRRIGLQEPVAPALTARWAGLLVKAGRAEEAVEPFRLAFAQASDQGREARAVVAAHLVRAFAPEGSDFDKVNQGITLFEESPPDPAMARMNERILARLYRLAKRDDTAVAQLQKLIASSRNDAERVELLFELAELHHTAGNLPEARRAYEEGLKYDPDNWMALNNLAYLLCDGRGEFALARPYAQRATTLTDNAAVLDTLGWIYVGLGEYAMAVAELSRAIRLAPDDPLAYYHLGEAYRRDGQFKAAQDVLQSALDMARRRGNDELLAECEASLERAARAERTP